MKIDKIEINEIKKVNSIYEIAREYMKETNNPTQWGDKYPPLSLIEEDILSNRLYGVRDEDSSLIAVFAISNEEKAYDNCNFWHSNSPYIVIHRVASNGKVKGVTKLIFNYALTKSNYIRIDTHKDNKTMQKALISYGFKECGIVFYERNNKKEERIAFDYLNINSL